MILQNRFALVTCLLFVSSIVFLHAGTPEADLGVTKSGPGQAAAGANITYTIEVVNGGPDGAANATMNDPLPPSTTFVSLSAPNGWQCTTPAAGSNGTVNCVNSSFPAGGDDVFTLVVKIDPQTPAGTFITNTVTVSTQSLDPNDENNSSSTATLVPEPSADLGVTKTVDSDQALANSNVTFTIQVTNFGPDAASTVALNDTLPGDMTFVSEQQTSGPTWTCSTPNVGSGGTVSCAVASLPVSSTSTFSITGHIPSGEPTGTVYTNTASLTSANDPNSENDSSDASTSVVAAAPTLTTQASGPVLLGGSISDTATLSGGFSATGTINFFVYGPDDSTCSSSPTYISTANVAGDGAYNSAPFVPSAPGTYRFVASYSGDDIFAGSIGSLTGGLTVGRAGTNIAVTASPTPSVFGQIVTFTATLSVQGPGDGTPTGTVQFVIDGSNVLGGFGKLRALLGLKGLLAELDVLERELVDLRFESVVVGPEVLDLGDRLPEPAGRRADLAKDALSGHQELRYEGGAGADEGRVTEEEQSEGDDEKPGEGPEEGVPRAWGAPRAPKSGHGPYLTRQTLVCL